MDVDVNISEIDGDDGELLRANFSRPFARYNGYTMFDEFKIYVDSLIKMNVRDDDIWVCSYPKTGKFKVLQFLYEEIYIL